MNKIDVKKYIGIFILVILLNPLKLISQNQPSEKEIKRSGLYFWGQAYNADTIEAKLNARNDLMFNISNLISNSGALNDKSEIFVKYIRYIYKPVEELTKAIAFVPKENVTSLIENKAPLVVTKMKYSEAQTNTNTNETPVKASILMEDKPIAKQAETVIKKDTVGPSENTLLGRLIACNTGNELLTILKKEESNNTLVFNYNSEVYRKKNSSEHFYIVIIDPNNNNIISFLDKGSLDRKDLKNEKKSINIEHESQNMIQVWIQLL